MLSWVRSCNTWDKIGTALLSQHPSVISVFWLSSMVRCWNCGPGACCVVSLCFSSFQSGYSPSWQHCSWNSKFILVRFTAWDLTGGHQLFRFYFCMDGLQCLTSTMGQFINQEIWMRQQEGGQRTNILLAAAWGSPYSVTDSVTAVMCFLSCSCLHQTRGSLVFERLAYALTIFVRTIA